MLTEELMGQVWDKFPDLKESQEAKDGLVGAFRQILDCEPFDQF